jgi:protein-tyrosine phosphatase
MKHDITLMYKSGGQKFYLGAIPSYYYDLDISVVISCITDVAKNPFRLEVLQIPFLDSWYQEDLPTDQQLSRWLETMKVLIDGRNVLFHCYQGMNRSALMLSLYLWTYHQKEFNDKNHLMSMLKEARHPIMQNSHFEKIFFRW